MPLNEATPIAQALLAATLPRLVLPTAFDGAEKRANGQLIPAGRYRFEALGRNHSTSIRSAYGFVDIAIPSSEVRSGANMTTPLSNDARHESP